MCVASGTKTKYNSVEGTRTTVAFSSTNTKKYRQSTMVNGNKENTCITYENMRLHIWPDGVVLWETNEQTSRDGCGTVVISSTNYRIIL